MNANQAVLPVRTMCRVLGVSASGFYAWQNRAPSQHAIDDTVLTERIALVHAESDAIYGSPNIHAELHDQGIRVGRKRVARLMRAAGLRGVSRRRRFVVTTRRDPKQRPAPDLVNREFIADGPNQLWVADMTYVADLGRASSTWPSCSMCGVDASWAGRWVRRLTRRSRLAALDMAGSAAPAARGDPSQRSRQPVHQPGLRAPLQGDRRASFDGQRGRRLRQRDG